LAPLQSAHLSPWSEFRPPLLGFVRHTELRFPTARAVSWTLQTLRPALSCEVGCRDSPPPACLPSVHSPESTLLPTRFGPEAACLGIVFRPRGFAPPRRLPPLGRLRACCIPLPVMGFAAFPALDSGSTRPPGRARHRAVGVPRHSPRRFSHPSKNSPRPQPHHITVAVAPLPFPPALLASPDRHRCQHRPLEIRLTGTPAARLSSAVGSVTLIRPLPASERPILPGLRSPSRSFPRLESSALSHSLPCIRREIRKCHDAAGAPFRTHETCASQATPASSLRRATSGGGRISMRPKTLAVDHLAPDIDGIPKDPTDREASTRPKPLDASHREPSHPKAERYGARCGRNPFVGSPRVENESRALPGLTEARIRGAGDGRCPLPSQCR
jgi:hypothetical protein